jgi:hypothetical protein
MGAVPGSNYFSRYKTPRSVVSTISTKKQIRLAVSTRREFVLAMILLVEAYSKYSIGNRV